MALQLRGLGYLGVNAVDVDEWVTLGTDVLGMTRSDTPGDEDTALLRMDEREWRIAIHRSDTPGLAYIGWELPGMREWEQAVRDLEDAGIAVKVDAELAEARGVMGLVRFTAPGGHETELYFGPRFKPNFVSPLGVEFVTENVGMGHVALIVPSEGFESVLDFYLDVMGFRVSEHVSMMGIKGALLHCTSRHHSLGLIGVGDGPGIHHFMVEVTDFDDVGRCWDRCQDRKVPIMLTLGRHSDDYMLGFYLFTPSGFGLEYGSGGRTIDPETWTATTLSSPSGGELWGHRPPDPSWPAQAPIVAGLDLSER